MAKTKQQQKFGTAARGARAACLKSEDQPSDFNACMCAEMKARLKKGVRAATRRKKTRVSRKNCRKKR